MENPIKDNFTAVGLAEGFIEAESEEQVIQAWAYIAKHKVWRGLQGFFGRTVHSLVEQGYITHEGDINWEVISENN